MLKKMLFTSTLFVFLLSSAATFAAQDETTNLPILVKNSQKGDSIELTELPLEATQRLIQAVKKGVCSGNKDAEITFSITLDPDSQQPVIASSNHQGIMIQIDCD